MSEHAAPLPDAVRIELLGQRHFLLEELAYWLDLAKRIGDNAYYRDEIRKREEGIARINKILERMVTESDDAS